jgi:hypothetical protein
MLVRHILPQKNKNWPIFGHNMYSEIKLIRVSV